MYSVRVFKVTQWKLKLDSENTLIYLERIYVHVLLNRIIGRVCIYFSAVESYIRLQRRFKGVKWWQEIATIFVRKRKGPSYILYQRKEGIWIALDKFKEQSKLEYTGTQFLKKGKVSIVTRYPHPFNYIYYKRSV